MCYVEGGKYSLNVTEVLLGEFNDTSFDILFWKGLFQNYAPQYTVKFKAVGSKSTIIQIIDIIEKEKIPNTVFCIDSEFDELHKKKVDKGNIIYSYGYSFENDIMNYENVVFCIGCHSGQKIEEDQQIKELLSNFFTEIKQYVIYDEYCFRKNIPFFDRESPNKHLNIQPNTCPTIKHQSFETMISALKPHSIQNDLIDIESGRYCFGHLVESFFYHFTRWILLKLGIKSIPKHSFLNSLIYNCVNTFDKIKNAYYEKEFTKIMFTN